MTTQPIKTTALDLTIDCQKILSCIARFERRGEKFGSDYIVKVLRGSCDRRIIAAGHNHLSTYGIGSDKSMNFWGNLVSFLIESHEIEADSRYGGSQKYDILRLNDRSWEVIHSKRNILITSKNWQNILIDSQKGSNQASMKSIVANSHSAGISISRIASIINKSEDRVFDILKNLIEDGYPVDINSLVTEAVQEKISQAFKELNCQDFKPVYDFLNHEYSYGLLFMAREKINQDNLFVENDGEIETSLNRMSGVSDTRVYGKTLDNNHQDSSLDLIEYFKTENQPLKKSLDSISKTLDSFSGATLEAKDGKISALYEALNAKDRELLELRYELQESYKEIEKERSNNLEQSKRDKKIEFNTQIKEVAKYTSNYNTELCAFIDQTQLDQTFSIELGKWLLSKLSHCLDNNQEVNLHDLIKIAQYKKRITDQGANYAHIIRSQRNLIAHEAVDPETLEVQNYLCLFSASLLLNEFSV